jgi:hypothetical protein
MRGLVHKVFRRADRPTATPADNRVSSEPDLPSPIERFETGGGFLAAASPLTQEIMRQAEQSRYRRQQESRIGPCGKRLTDEAAAREVEKILDVDRWPLLPWLPFSRSRSLPRGPGSYPGRSSATAEPHTLRPVRER